MERLENATRVSALFFVLGLPSRVTAQGQMPPRVAQQISNARKTGDVGFAMRILRQVDGAQSAATLDALADSLTAIVFDGPVTTRHTRTVHSSAIEALSASADSAAPIKYAGAGGRLFKIAMKAPDMGDRAQAISEITRLANVQEALLLLRRIAVSDNILAVKAVAKLWDGMADRGGVEVLRELYTTGAVTEVDAVQGVAFAAKKNGFRK